MKIIFVKAEDSIPWTTSIAKRYKAMVQYRKDLELPETSFTIMSLSEEFNSVGLYGKDNPTHFTPEIAAAAFNRIVDKAVDEALMDVSRNDCPLVIVVVAGWNAERHELSSNKEALCGKHLSLCCHMPEFVYWARLHSHQLQWVPTLKTSLPKVLYQTFKEELPEAKKISEAALPWSFTREVHTDKD